MSTTSVLRLQRTSPLRVHSSIAGVMTPPSVNTRSEDMITPTRMHSRCEAQLPCIQRRQGGDGSKRRLIDTPTQVAIQSLQPTNTSPLVAGLRETITSLLHVIFRFWRRRKQRQLQTLGRSVGARNRSAIARQSLTDLGIREKILCNLGKELQNEMTRMCRKKPSSIFRASSTGALICNSKLLLTLFITKQLI